MKKPLIVLVGNKVDETSRRQVSYSARRGQGVLSKFQMGVPPMVLILDPI